MDKVHTVSPVFFTNFCQLRLLYCFDCKSLLPLEITSDNFLVCSSCNSHYDLRPHFDKSIVPLHKVLPDSPSRETRLMPDGRWRKGKVRDDRQLDLFGGDK